MTAGLRIPHLDAGPPWYDEVQTGKAPLYVPAFGVPYRSPTMET